MDFRLGSFGKVARISGASNDPVNVVGVVCCLRHGCPRQPLLPIPLGSRDTYGETRSMAFLFRWLTSRSHNKTVWVQIGLVYAMSHSIATGRCKEKVRRDAPRENDPITPLSTYYL